MAARLLVEFRYPNGRRLEGNAASAEMVLPDVPRLGEDFQHPVMQAFGRVKQVSPRRHVSAFADKSRPATYDVIVEIDRIIPQYGSGGGI